MLDLMMGMGIDSGHCLSKQHNKCSKYKMEFSEQIIDLSAPLIAPHSFSNY